MVSKKSARPFVWPCVRRPKASSSAAVGWPLPALADGLGGLWLVLYAVILVQLPDPNPVALGLSLAYLAYYLVASVLLTSLHRFRQVHARPADVTSR